MTTVSSDVSSEAQIPLSKLQALQFEWLSRAGRLSGAAVMVIDTDLKIKFYDKYIAEILELDTTIDFTDNNLLEITEQLAKRGDFGPGEPQIFTELVKNLFSKPVDPKTVFT